MLDQVTAAFARQDYRTAARLLKQLVQQEPKNPLVRLYVGRLHEATGKLEEAETVYRQLLLGAANSQVVAQARQGVERVKALEQERRRQALSSAHADPNSTQPGVLVLEPIDPETKQIAAQKLARIMQLDPYTARLQLPTRGWRLYRTGPVGELKFYASSLQQASIPCFWSMLADLQAINVFQINYLAETSPEGNASVVCKNAQGQLGSLTFNWQEVAQRVEGLLPLFEEVVDRDARGKPQRKTQTLDYVQFCDLHLPGRNSILRLGDRHYQFQQGMMLTRNEQPPPPRGQATTRENWNTLRDFLNRQLPQIPVWSDFTTFAGTALAYEEMLKHLPSHIDLFRREETPWDPAFQLYSGLVFLKEAASQNGHCPP